MQEQKITIDELKEYIYAREITGIIFRILEEYMNIRFEKDKITLFNTEEDLKTVTHPFKRRKINYADIQSLSLRVINKAEAIVTVAPIGIMILFFQKS